MPVGPQPGPFRTDRVHLSLPMEMVDAIDRRAHAQGIESEDVLERAIGGEADWERAIEQRRIVGVVPHDGRGRSLQNFRPAPVHCDCCPALCRCQMFWRGKYRCQCTPERVSGLQRDEEQR